MKSRLSDVTSRRRRTRKSEEKPDRDEGPPPSKLLRTESISETLTLSGPAHGSDEVCLKRWTEWFLIKGRLCGLSRRARLPTWTHSVCRFRLCKCNKYEFSEGNRNRHVCDWKSWKIRVGDRFNEMFYDIECLC